MKVLIAAATSLEIAPLQNERNSAALAPGLELEVLITGPGLLPSSFALTQALLQFKPQWVIQAGIAGSFSASFPPGAIALVSEERMGDAGVTEAGQFRDLFQMGLLQPDHPPFRQGALSNPHLQKANRLGLPEAKAITVNEITTAPERIQFLRQQYAPDLESMEGAALHYAALQLAIPFLQLRAVSNMVGERDKSKWIMAPAIARLNETLFRILETLTA